MSGKVGDIGEARFISKCLEYGFVPCKPFSQNCLYDLVLVTDQRIYKIQIKTSSKMSVNGRYEFNTCHGSSSKSTYSGYDIDLIVCYILDTDDFYLIFKQQFQNKKRINIYANGTKFDMFKNNLGML